MRGASRLELMVMHMTKENMFVFCSVLIIGVFLCFAVTITITITITIAITIAIMARI